MKKKVLFMTLAAAVFLTACGGQKETESAGADTTAAAETEEEPEAAPDVSEETAKAEDSGQETEDALEPETEDTSLAGEFAKGIVSENGWESEFLGMRYTAPEGILMATDEELNEVMGIGRELLAGDFSEQQMKYAEMQSIYEMMSSDPTGLPNVFIAVEKIPIAGIRLEQYVEAVEHNISLVSVADNTILSDDETVDIGGAAWRKISCLADYSGNGTYILNQDYYVRMVGDRAATMVMTYMEDMADIAEQMLNAFTPY